MAFTSPSLGSRTAFFVVKTVGPDFKYWQFVVYDFLAFFFGFELGMPKMSRVLEEALECLLQCQLCITEG